MSRNVNNDVTKDLPHKFVVCNSCQSSPALTTLFLYAQAAKALNTIIT